MTYGRECAAATRHTHSLGGDAGSMRAGCAPIPPRVRRRQIDKTLLNIDDGDPGRAPGADWLAAQ